MRVRNGPHKRYSPTDVAVLSALGDKTDRERNGVEAHLQIILVRPVLMAFKEVLLNQLIQHHNSLERNNLSLESISIIFIHS